MWAGYWGRRLGGLGVSASGVGAGGRGLCEGSFAFREEEGWEWEEECSTTCMVSEAELGLVPQGALLHPIVCTQELERSKPCSEGEGLGRGVTGSQAGASKRAARGKGAVKGYSSREVSRSAKERNKRLVS